ncbi:Vitamin B6 transporter bsu1 [Madurella mycetomatis]|uniref:Vitamin B6 transporter bsu1 n=1 Tax=Madurella mycetomatis TaxID=100816 RepID=A0A175WI21_9PEZI|nr:Vitamin B6 transporter bsu1 [Madurella mycetomatis]
MSVAKMTDALGWSASRSWFLVCVYCAWETIALTLSTLYSFAQPVIQERYSVPNVQIVALGQSMQIFGNMFGVALLSPISCGTFATVPIQGTAYAPNLPTLIFFMFMSGVAWSTSLSLVPAAFSDLYLHRDDIGQPIALFVIGASVGPSIGGVVATAMLNADADLKWYFLVTVIVSGACAVPMLFVPETLPPKGMRDGRGRNGNPLHTPVAQLQDGAATIPSIDRRNAQSGIWYLTRVWVLLATEPIIWITGVYNGLANGVFVLTVVGSITTLADFKGLPLMDAASSLIFACIGVVLVWFVMPFQTRLYREDKAEHKGRALPESRLLLLRDVLWIFPVALFWSAFTGDAQYNKWHQSVSCGLVAFTDSFLYQCLLIYILGEWFYSPVSNLRAHGH